MSSPPRQVGGKGGKRSGSSPKVNEKKVQEQAARAARKAARADKKAKSLERGDNRAAAADDTTATSVDAEGASSAPTASPTPTPQTKPLKPAKSRGENDSGSRRKAKVKMRMSCDIRDRIIWDESIDRTKFIVGYEDRFVGILEGAFDDFNWADFVTLSHVEKAIPLHRIVYFKYMRRTVWDRRCRLDDFFGSQGGVTIDRVMAEYDPADYPPSSSDDASDDGDDDDGAAQGSTATAGNASAPAAPAAAAGWAPSSSVAMDDPTRPNYFVSLRVRATGVVAAARRVQQGALAVDDRLVDGCIPPEKLHITLLTLRIDPTDNEERFAAVTALNQACEALAEQFPAPSKLTLAGVDTFRDRVLHARLHPIDSTALSRYQRVLRRIFVDDNCVAVAGDHGQFTPHMTLLKLSREMCRTIGSIDRRAYCGFNESTELGKFEVEGLELCQMGKQTDNDGYYARLCPGVPNTPWADVPNNRVQHSRNLAPAELSCDLFNPQTVVILRGIPGSGKSTVVRQLTEGYTAGPASDVAVCSADRHMVDPTTGDYTFDLARLPAAHAACQSTCAHALRRGSPLIIIDNTNVTPESYTEYERMAAGAAYRVAVIECICPSRVDVKRFAARCTHHVPLASTAAMHARWIPDARAYRIDTRSSTTKLHDSSDGAGTVGPTLIPPHAAGTMWQGGKSLPGKKALYVFDFDRTLCNTLGPEHGVAAWETATNTVWSKRGWVSQPESLLPPMPLPSGPALPLWTRCAGRLDAVCVVMSGRIDALRSEMEFALAHLLPGDAPPDRVILKPTDNDTDTADWKETELREMIRQLPDLEKVVVIDDDPKVLAVLSALATGISTAGGPTIRVVDALTLNTPSASASASTTKPGPVASFLASRGLLQTPTAAANANDALQFVAESWSAVLMREDGAAVADMGSDLVRPYGGYALGRSGDLDLCLLAPAWWQQKRCVVAMEVELECRGVAWVYVAHSSRCPRLRLSLAYSNSTAVEVDLVFAPVVDEHGVVDLVVETPCPLGLGGASLGHDGVAFTAYVAETLLSRGLSSPHPVGMAVELAVAVLAAHHLKGNHFHALRTCHVVEIARAAIACGDGLMRGSLTAERIFQALARRASRMETCEWKALVGDSCPPQLLERYSAVWSDVCAALDHAGGSAVTAETYDAMCRPRQFPASGHRAVNVTVACREPIAHWMSGVYARGRLPTSFRALLEGVPDAVPGPTLLGSTLSFSIPDTPTAEALAHAALKGFVGELRTFCGATATVEVTVGEPGRLNPLSHRLPHNASRSLVSAVRDIDTLAGAEGPNEPLELPPMESGERFFVHRYAKQSGLCTKSLGDGADRRVVVIKA